MNGLDRTPLIVIVDDEDMVLTSLRSFLHLETDYNVETYTSPKEALDNLDSKPLDLVISDYLMPEMNGIDFLLQVKNVHPFSTRILLTGYADKENAIKAINQVGLFQYIEKPWDNDDLRIIIRNGLEKKRLLAKLSEKVGEINRAYGELQGIQQEILKAFA